MDNRQEPRWIQLPFEGTGVSTGESAGEKDFQQSVWYPNKVLLAEAVQQAKIFAEFAAKHHFHVGFPEILAKLATSDETTLITTHDGASVAFASQLNPRRLRVNKGFSPSVRYLNGIIVDPDIGRQGVCTRLLISAGAGLDVVIGHTQNRHMLSAFRKAFEFVWPSENRARLRKGFADQLAIYLESIGRPPNFSRTTGLVPCLYSGPLYQQDGDGSARNLSTNGDGILVLGFKCAETYAQAVENVVKVLRWPLSNALWTQPRESLPAASTAMNSLIVGWGHAARELHEPCLRKASERDTEPRSITGRIGLVEHDSLIQPVSGMPFFRRIEEAADFNPENTVVHMCTGPAERATAILEAARCGFKKFILEKPLAASHSQLNALLQAVKDYSLEIAVDFPWLGTPLTRKLKEIIDSKEHGELRALSMLQTKSRAYREHEPAGHDTAFEIEAPHQVSLALLLAGRHATVLDASCHSLHSEAGAIPSMGGTSMLLDHCEVISNLRSELDCPVKERRIELYFQDGWRCVGWYPADGVDGSQRLTQFDQNGRPRHHQKFFDDPLSSFFLESYRYFSGNGPRPVSTLDLAVATANLISTAKSVCGVEVRPSGATLQGEPR